MIHLAHPDAPDVIAEADEDRAAILRSAGWQDVKPPKSDKD